MKCMKATKKEGQPWEYEFDGVSRRDLNQIRTRLLVAFTRHQRAKRRERIKNERLNTIKTTEVKKTELIVTNDIKKPIEKETTNATD